MGSGQQISFALHIPVQSCAQSTTSVWQVEAVLQVSCSCSVGAAIFPLTQVAASSHEPCDLP